MPLAIDLSLLLVIFLVIGSFYRHYSLSSIKRSGKVVCLFVLLLASIPSVLFNGKVDLMNREFGNILLFFFSSVTGSLIVFFITPKGKNRVLSFLGQNSLIIYLVQSITLSFTTVIYNHFVASQIDCYNSQLLYALIGIIDMATAVLLCCPIVWLVNKYCPWVIGKQIKKI